MPFCSWLLCNGCHVLLSKSPKVIVIWTNKLLLSLVLFLKLIQFCMFRWSFWNLGIELVVEFILIIHLVFQLTWVHHGNCTTSFFSRNANPSFLKMLQALILNIDISGCMASAKRILWHQ